MKLISTLKAKRIHAIRFHLFADGSESMFTACEDSVVRVYSIPASADELELESAASLIGHANRCVNSILPADSPNASLLRRVKSVEIVKANKQDYAITISSDGKIHIYLLSSLKGDIEPCATYDTKGSRLTCLTVSTGFSAGSKKADEADESSDESDSEGSSESESEESS